MGNLDGHATFQKVESMFKVTRRIGPSWPSTRVGCGARLERRQLWRTILTGVMGDSHLQVMSHSTGALAADSSTWNGNLRAGGGRTRLLRRSRETWPWKQKEDGTSFPFEKASTFLVEAFSKGKLVPSSFCYIFKPTGKSHEKFENVYRKPTRHGGGMPRSTETQRFCGT